MPSHALTCPPPSHPQIEHHLFPAISFMHYPAISKIVEEECVKRGIQYAHYDTLPQIISRFTQYMKEVGVAPEEKGSEYTTLMAKL
jgi:fatty acid desaturase